METNQALNNLPHRPGVYIFRNKENRILYVGKAIDLSRRVRGYFQNNRNDWGIHDIQTIETVSEFDALILEAKLIRTHMPKYNATAKDDKSPLYVVFTLSQQLPRIIFTRKTQLPNILKRNKHDVVFGPFQSAKMVRSIMRQLRHVIPYCTQKERNGRPCFYTHLGLCRPCPSLIVKLPGGKIRQQHVLLYRKNIFRLKNILSGKTTGVLRQMESGMRFLAEHEQFEAAANLRNQIQAFYEILSKRYDPMVYLGPGGTTAIYERELIELHSALRPYFPGFSVPHRIECIDVSNIQGKHATGSLVVLTDGRKDPDSYRRFRIKTIDGSNDTAMIAEVICRRFAHKEWPTPDLLVIDGGKGQVRTVLRSRIWLRQTPVPIIGLAKRFEEIIIPLQNNRWKILRLDLTSPALHVIERVRDEAHRFAVSYHRLMRSSEFDTIST